jgi:hypothetical protein
MTWLNDWQEAAKHPTRTLLFLCVGGLVVCGLIGYFRFGDSIGWGFAAGLLGATALTKLGALTLANVGRRGPSLAQPRVSAADSRVGIAFHVLRLALLFGTIPVALIIGLTTGSGIAFLVTIAVGLLASLLIGGW